jgi:hypothetical protein
MLFCSFFAEECSNRAPPAESGQQENFTEHSSRRRYEKRTDSISESPAMVTAMLGLRSRVQRVPPFWG